MSTKVSALCKGLLTVWALEGSLPGMLPKVVSQITTFLEDTSTVWVFALEVQFDPLCLRILDSYSLMPLLRDAIKGLMLASS